VGVLEFNFENVISMSRSKICATITGTSNVKKSVVRKRLVQVFSGSVILKGKTEHEIDAIATVLTLGIILKERGIILKEISYWDLVFDAIMEGR